MRRIIVRFSNHSTTKNIFSKGYFGFSEKKENMKKHFLNSGAPGPKMCRNIRKPQETVAPGLENRLFTHLYCACNLPVATRHPPPARSREVRARSSATTTCADSRTCIAGPHSSNPHAAHHRRAETCGLCTQLEQMPSQRRTDWPLPFLRSLLYAHAQSRRSSFTSNLKYSVLR